MAFPRLAPFRPFAPFATSVDVDLASYAGGFSDVLPVFAVSTPGCGSVQLLADRHTARFTRPVGFVAFAFTFTITDASTFIAHVAVAVHP